MKLRMRFSQWLIIAILIVVLLAGYITAAQTMSAIGFPLDDAWIHQTYARNLGVFGEWAFLRGQPSAGSTAPAWTFWLAIGYWLRIEHFFWAFVSGAFALVGIAFFGAVLEKRGTQNNGFPWVSVFLVCEWHLVWAALSGMETLIFGAAVLGVFLSLSKPSFNNWAVGVLIGFSCWLRPDGITLLGPALFVLGLSGETMKQRVHGGLKISLGFASLFIPYLFFNHIYAGSVWPNTFFAKQAEYALSLQLPLVQRLSSLVSLPLVGAGIILTPGFIYACFRFIKDRTWWGLGAILWWLGFTLLYSLRLPVTYQHGRYLIPAMPIFWAIGWIGSKLLIDLLKQSSSRMRLVRFAGILSLSFLLLTFLVLGGKSYSEDVAIINTEMVETAVWVEKNTQPGALIGAHDIGALGYFSGRELVDLAGLVSPDVIPFIREEQRLLNYLLARGAAYLVTFPGWYPQLTTSLDCIYQSRGSFSPLAGGENMAVFIIEK